MKLIEVNCKFCKRPVALTEEFIGTIEVICLEAACINTSALANSANDPASTTRTTMVGVSSDSCSDFGGEDIAEGAWGVGIMGEK